LIGLGLAIVLLAPRECRRRDDRRLLFVNDRLGLGRFNRPGFRWRLVVDPRFFITPAAAPRHQGYDCAER
jgi:hypothetical protein